MRVLGRGIRRVVVGWSTSVLFITRYEQPCFLYFLRCTCPSHSMCLLQAPVFYGRYGDDSRFAPMNDTYNTTNSSDPWWSNSSDYNEWSTYSTTTIDYLWDRSDRTTDKSDNWNRMTDSSEVAPRKGSWYSTTPADKPYEYESTSTTSSYNTSLKSRTTEDISELRNEAFS